MRRSIFLSLVAAGAAAVLPAAARSPVPGPAPALILTLIRPQSAPAAPLPHGHRLPLAWRVCPGTEESALVLAGSTPRDNALSPVWPHSVSLLLTPPIAGCRVTSEAVRGPAGSHFLLVHLKAPAGARPGPYEGLLTVRHVTMTARLRLAAEVLPFELMRPSKQYAVTRVPVNPLECRAPDKVDVDSLRRLHETGIGALCLDAPPAVVDRPALEDAMRAAGMRGPVLAPAASGDHKDGQPTSDRVRLRVQSPPASPHQTAIRWYALYAGTPPGRDAAAPARAAGMGVACRMPSAWIDTETREGGARGVDLPIFDAAGAYAARLIGRDTPLGASATGWWRWDPGAATVLENRLRSGALLWKCGLSGALLEIAPDATARAAWPLRWDGVCQGLNDSRYLTTLFSLMRQVKDMDRSSRLPGEAEGEVKTALDGLVQQSSPAAADRFRESVITWIVRLSRVVGS